MEKGIAESVPERGEMRDRTSPERGSWGRIDVVVDPRSEHRAPCTPRAGANRPPFGDADERQGKAQRQEAGFALVGAIDSVR